MKRTPGLLAGAVGVAATAALSLWAAPRLPLRVPLHWNLAGEVDRYGSRAEALLLGPLLIAGLSALLWALPRIDPRRANLERSARAYNAVWMCVVAVVVGAHAVTLLAGLGHAVPVGALAAAATGAVFCVIGNYLSKTRSNWFFGIRTPWTLSSDRSWQRTHRLAGRLFVVVGAAVALAALLSPQVAFWVLLVGGAGITVVACAYSYIVWRGDPACQAHG